MDRNVLMTSDKVWRLKIPASTVQIPGIMILSSFLNRATNSRFTVGFLEAADAADASALFGSLVDFERLSAIARSFSVAFRTKFGGNFCDLSFG